MKKPYILLCLLLLIISCEQKKLAIPEIVSQAFKENYPHAKEADWAEKENSYEVNFIQDTIRYEAEFNKKGLQVEEETMLDKNNLPTAIQDYLSENYPHLFIGEASIEQKGEDVVYELELLNGFFKEIELEFDMNGKFLSKETFKN